MCAVYTMQSINQQGGLELGCWVGTPGLIRLGNPPVHESRERAGRHLSDTGSNQQLEFFDLFVCHVHTQKLAQLETQVRHGVLWCSVWG